MESQNIGQIFYNIAEKGYLYIELQRISIKGQTTSISISELPHSGTLNESFVLRQTNNFFWAIRCTFIVGNR